MNNKLKHWFETYLKKNQVDEKTVDIKSLYDSTLSYQENKQIMVDYVEALINKKENNEDELIAKQEAYELEQIKERDAKALEEIKQSSTPKINKYFEKLESYVKMVSKGYSNALFIVGSTALGKTYNTLRILAEENADVDYVVGKITPLDMYHTLYENKNSEKITIFDDTISLIKNDDCMALLLSALWSSSGNRVVNWRSTSAKLKAPKKFNFDGRIIFMLNEVPDSDEMRTLLSRCMTYHFSLTYLEKLQMMYEIAKLPHKNLTPVQRHEVVEFLEQNTNPATKDFNLRLQSKVEQMYLYDKNKWKSLTLTQLQSDKNIQVVQELMELGISVKEQKKEFAKRTGMTERSYHNYKARLKGE